jgi:hypothetical protein
VSIISTGGVPLPNDEEKGYHDSLSASSNQWMLTESS